MFDFTVQDMLCTLDALVEFEADRITDIAIIDRFRHWSCIHLQRLRLGVQILKGGNNVLLWQMARVTELEERGGLMLESPDFGVRLRLTDGLGTLATLRKLRAIKMIVLEEPWDADEAQWSLEHWPNIDELSSAMVDEEAVQVLGTSVRVM